MKRAVAGMSCMTPPAPAGETAAGLYADSRAAIAATRRGSTPCCFDASAMSDERYAGIGVVTGALELKSAAPDGVALHAVRSGALQLERTGDDANARVSFEEVIGGDAA